MNVLRHMNRISQLLDAIQHVIFLVIYPVATELQRPMSFTILILAVVFSIAGEEDAVILCVSLLTILIAVGLLMRLLYRKSGLLQYTSAESIFSCISTLFTLRELKRCGVHVSKETLDVLSRATCILTDVDGALTENSPSIVRVVSYSDIAHPELKNKKHSSPDAIDALQWAYMTLEGSSDPREKMFAHTISLESSDVAALHRNFTRKKALPFDEDAGYAAALFEMQHLDLVRIVLVGRPSALLPLVKFYYSGGVAQILSSNGKQLIEDDMHAAAHRGLESVAVVYCDISESGAAGFSHEAIPLMLKGKSHVFGAFAHVGDGLRLNIHEAILLAKQEHIELVVATGHSTEYVSSLARVLGWNESLVLTSGELSRVMEGERGRVPGEGVIYSELQGKDLVAIYDLLGGTSRVIRTGVSGVTSTLGLYGVVRSMVHVSNTKKVSELALFVTLMASLLVVVFVVMAYYFEWGKEAPIAVLLSGILIIGALRVLLAVGLGKYILFK